MGEREKIALRGVVGQGAEVRGLPQKGILQSLLAEGVIRGRIDAARAGNIEAFTPVFDKSDVIKPIARRTRQIFLTSPGAVLELSLAIEAPQDQIIVIRALTWETSFGTVNIPINTNVRFVGREDDLGGAFPFLNSNAPVPISNRVIGDVDSLLSGLFYQVLPLALLSGDSLVFNQTISPPAILGSRLIWFEETYLSPFRPAGL